MIFLDLEIPEYTYMRIQESKTPSLLKTIRGKGTIENSNEFGYDERLHLNFLVNESNLIELMKLQARFQTMCLIPMFSKNLKDKIFKSYLEYQKNLLNTFMLNAGIENENKREQTLENIYNKKAEFLGIENIKELGYKVNPNVNDCIMVFLESFSVKTIQDSSNGYEVELIIWVCNDLTFFNGKEQEFLNNYYKKFNLKRTVFKEIDEIIENLFKNKIDDINIIMDNVWNNQKTYNPDKKFEKLESPNELNILNKYIQQIEVRMMNNLVRLPIIGKHKGFIQHLGKGEIGITVKLALNQKNALEEKVIHQIKSLALYDQEYITVSDCNFFLMKAFDIKELNLCTSVIEEPNDDVDVTVVTLFFVGASTNKTEIEADYFTNMNRANNTKTIKYFSNFLDILISPKATVFIDEIINNGYSNLDKNSFYSDEIFNKYNNANEEDKIKIQTKLDEKSLLGFFKIILSRSLKESDIVNSGDEERDLYNTKNFTIFNLVSTYRQYRLPYFISGLSTEDTIINEELKKIKEEFEKDKNNILTGFGKFFVNSEKVAKDNIYYDIIKFRIQNLAYRLLLSYINIEDNDKKKLNYNDIRNLEETSQAEFVEEIMKYFTVDFFSVDDFKDMRKRFIIAISAVFKIEVFNSFCILLKEIMDNPLCKKYLGSNNTKLSILIEENKIDYFNNQLKELLYNSIVTVFNKMQTIVSTESFFTKAYIYIKANWYDNQESVADNSIQKALQVEIDKFIKRFDAFKNKIINEKFENNLFNQILLILKLEIIGIKLDKTMLFAGYTEGHKYTNQIDSSERTYTNFGLEIQSLLLGESIMSLMMADISYEKSIIGVIATESAKNFVGPFSISYAAIENEIGNKAEEINEFTNNKNIIEFKTNANEEQLNKINRYEKFLYLKKVIKRIFGEEALQYFLDSSSSFIRVSTNNKDFQKIFNKQVFNNFDSPMEFIKDLSIKGKTYRELFNGLFNLFDNIDKKAKNKTEQELLQSLTKEDNEETKKLVEEIKEGFLSYQEVADTIAENTIRDPESSSAFMNSVALQSELLSDFKYIRALKSATKMLTTQYEMMMPDYEIYIIDENEMQMAFERGYDIQNKIYAIRNVISINIKKDDVTNIKTAIVKILNVKPIDIGMNTMFESKNVISDNNVDPEIVYGNKFVTKRMAFKQGMLINIALDTNSNYYDFTGKIETVNLNRNVITLTCTSFASELLSKSFDMDNKYVYGVFNWISGAVAGIKNKLYDRGKSYNKAKIDNANYYIVPDKIYKRLSDESGEYKKAYDMSIAGATGLIYSAIEKAGDSLKHFFYPYNDLMQGKNLSENLNNSNSILGNSEFFTNLLGYSDIIANRITENINAIDFDISFYGISKRNPENRKYNVSTGKEYVYYDIGHSSFVGKGVFDKKTDKVTTDKDDSEMYCYERPNIKMYDVLNDIQLRNPASYWDVIESGHYATLFLGRNNYMIKRKNKTSTLTKIEIERMCNFIDFFLKEHKQLTTCVEKLYTDQLIDYINLFRSLASVYDSSYQMDDYIVNILKKYNTSNPLEISYNDKNEVVSKNIEGYDLASDIHLAVSGYNLLACDIKINENYSNTIDLIYDPTISDRIGRWFQLEFGDANKVKLKSFKELPNDRIKAKVIEPSLTRDVHDVYQGFEVAQSLLFKELRDYYSGKIVTLYIPDLKKNDEILLIDSRHSVQGTVIVKDFQHILDSESGLITIITPGMKIKTSSLMNDIYLTGFFNEIEYEFQSSQDSIFNNQRDNLKKLNEVNQNVYVELKELFGNISDAMPQIPITFENTGFNFNYKQNITSKENDKKIETKTITKDDWTGIVTPRNENNLPIKLYPLIQNGQALIPDEDIYNSQSEENSTVKKLISAALYSFRTLKNWSKGLGYINESLSLMIENLDLTDTGMYRNIIKQFLPGFENYPLDKCKQESLAARLVSDDFEDFTVDETTNVIYDRNLSKQPNICFLNCQRLNQFDDERISKIAKIIFHFELINLVELDGRANNENDTSKIEFENNDFTVVNKILEKLKELSKRHNKNSEWEIVVQGRLLPDGPIKTNEYAYDDVGVVFYNKNDTFTVDKLNNEVIRTSVEEQGKILDIGRNVLKYNIIFNREIVNIQRTTCFVFHNYYGDSNISETTISYRSRCELMRELMKKVSLVSNALTNFAVFGDFNLHVVDKKVNNELYVKPNANNNIYILSEENAKVGLRWNESTTIGNKTYDQMIFSDGSNYLGDTYEKQSIFKNIEGTKVMKQYYYIKANGEDIKLISDHFPIYTNIKVK